MKKRTRKRRTSLYLVMLVIGLFLTTLIVQGVNLKSNCRKLSTEQAQLQEKKKNLEKEREQIQEEAEYRKTDKYIEDTAREKFGLVYDNEIIFKAEDAE